MKKHGSHKQGRSLRSSQIIPLGFLLLIAVGTLLLLLPVSTAGGRRTDVLTALFTATTSVCVTGLVTVDTFSHWSAFGQAIILVLIQLGGLGVVAVSSSVLLLFGKSFSIKDRVLLRDAFNLDTIQGLLRFLLRVVLGVFSVEAVGAALYAFAFVPRFGLGRGLWYALFHAVSAFCNAGLDILGPNSLIPYANDGWVLFVTMALIVIGGLGYIVWFDVVQTCALRCRRQRGARLGEHTRLVLLLTAGLIFVGALAVLLLEGNNPYTLGSMPFGQKVLHSLFQSVTFRTAGFAAIPQGRLTEGTTLLGCLWMFIGGSPMGTAGGVKTVTLFAIAAGAVSYVQKRRETVVFRRQIPAELLQKAAAIVLMSLSVTLLAALVLLYTERLPLSDVLYETFSATATVGLSRGITQSLSPAGRLIVIICMYLGRIGPISMALFFRSEEAQGDDIQHAQGRFFVG